MLALVPLLALPELLDAMSHAAGDDHGPSLSLVAGLSGWQVAAVTLGCNWRSGRGGPAIWRGRFFGLSRRQICAKCLWPPH